MTTPHRTELILRATRRVLPNFSRYSIKVDMLDVGNPWTFSLWYSKNVESAWAMIVREVKLGGQIIFSIDGAPQLNGRIETFSVNTTRKNGSTLVISGRDLAGPAVDWDAHPSIYLRNRPLDEVIQAILAPYEITAVVGAGADAEREVRTRARPGARGAHQTSQRSSRRNIVDLVHPRPNETGWQVIQSVLRRLGYMAWIAPSVNGELAIVVDTPNYNQRPLFTFKRRLRNGIVTNDSNVLESDFHAQIRTIPTQVYAYGRVQRGNRSASNVGTSSSTRGLINLGDLPSSILGNISQGVVPTGNSPLVNFTTDQTRQVLNAITAPLHGRNTRDARRQQNRTGRSTGASSNSQTTHESRITRLPFANNELLQYPFVERPLPPQPKHLHSPRARSAATGGQEAKRYIAHAMKDFRSVAIVVQGHGQTIDNQMRLYAPNVMARYIDDLLDIDEDMLITSVEFNGDREGGQETKLTLGTKGAITLEPEAS